MTNKNLTRDILLSYLDSEKFIIFLDRNYNLFYQHLQVDRTFEPMV